ncbi:unnamed protein product [Calypogeia fissa]
MAESIYKVSRRIKRTEQTVYNALRSIYEDSLFVMEIRHLWTDMPLLANLRCGLWYAREFDGTCYFKSTDGHNGNWSFSTIRLNLHVATLAAERGGCCIVDATRKGKRFPDSMSKTIPIWACVLNRALADFRPPRTQEIDLSSKRETAKDTEDSISNEDLLKETSLTEDWDSTLHLPLWVSNVEKANIESRIDGWVESLKSTGADLAALAKVLKKPLRPLWISQKTVIWLNEVPDLEDWDFTPIILVSASRPSAFTQRFTDAEFSWSYIPGAADDEESWARGLTPDLFWRNSLEIISGGPSTCNGKVADIVEKDRVYKAVRGHYAPQVRAKAGVQEKVEVGETLPSSFVNGERGVHGHPGLAMGSFSNGDATVTQSERLSTFQSKKNDGELEDSRDPVVEHTFGKKSSPVLRKELADSMRGFHWIGNTGLAVGNADCASSNSIYEVADCIINCGTSSSLSFSSQTESSLYLPIVGPKFDRHSLQNHLAKAVAFAREKLLSGSAVFIYCSNGEDISVCVCLAVLLSCFNSHGELEDRATMDKVITKSDVRERLIYLSSFNSDARPSRGSLRQVFNFFNPTGA